MMLILFLKYIASAVIIVTAGVSLVKAGDEVAEFFGLSRLWLGTILIAFVTSLPELVTTITSIRLNLPSMALSNVLGSNLLNITALSFILLFFSLDKFNNSSKEESDSLSSLNFSIVLICAITLFVKVKINYSLFSLGIDSLIILVSYFIFIKIFFKQESKKKDNFKTKDYSVLFKPAILYVVCSLFIVFGGIWSVKILNQISGLTGWSEQFLGILFLAFATSLPEIVVMVQSFRMGSFNMLTGIIIGSNLFNLCIIGVSDFFIDKNIFTVIDLKNMFTCFCLLVLSTIFSLVFYFKKKKQFLNLKKVCLIVILSYILIMCFIYKI